VVEYRFPPASLTTETPLPEKPDKPSYADAIEAGAQYREAAQSCNVDKATIRAWVEQNGG
jgi:hypothetical protein